MPKAHYSAAAGSVAAAAEVEVAEEEVRASGVTAGWEEAASVVKGLAVEAMEALVAMVEEEEGEWCREDRSIRQCKRTSRI